MSRNVYDVAMAQSGDPMGVASSQAATASSKLGQFKKDQEIVKFINEQIKKAQERAQKNKGISDLIGSAVDMFVPGGSYVVEKLRQKKYDPMSPLEEAKRKYAGRGKVERNLDTTMGNLDAALDSMATSNLMSSLSIADVIPFDLGKVADTVGIADTAKAAVKDATTQALDATTQIPFAQGPSILDIVGGLKDAGAGTVADKISPFSLDFSSIMNNLPGMLPKGVDKVAKDALGKLQGSDFFDSTMGQIALGTGRVAALPLLNQLLGEWEGPQFQADTFRNPYRGY
tara:strand:+ start:246 stop:1103 length:858 start_codon:yes stop_codon:yes gene_type:complete